MWNRSWLDDPERSSRLAQMMADKRELPSGLSSSMNWNHLPLDYTQSMSDFPSIQAKEYKMAQDRF